MVEEKENVHDALVLPENAVAKFCTHTHLEALNQHNVLLTLCHKMGEQSIVISRVAIDMEHVKNLVRSLNQFLDDAEKKDGGN
ncbi:MAG: hypothetical protein EAZ74_04570 [Alphaproteobacteria bacterium]|nr:MAG: hypothetical protein EAY76_06115 [Alphaproteobacteria bacterium]TAF14176.1 MAG: hypothetical protein EAZ74_04570 [Alphaproteobacteria bacterium]TAF39159.1 MAG: hypothetical protein EAZ66_05200 [Alphaproteobacteria bacterium]TAF74952.1 MAG: hypothetical protein EAZ52_07835 [Alphaproteobacteria bacterium]